MLWWNINRRLNDIVTQTSPLDIYTPDIVFTLETSTIYENISEKSGYKKFADSIITTHSNHGGIALFVTKHLSSHIFEIRYEKCFISFRINYIPHFVFIGTYIQPENSPYFDPAMFCHLCNILLTCNDRKLIPILGIYTRTRIVKEFYRTVVSLATSVNDCAVSLYIRAL